MPYKDLKKQREYQRQWMAKRRSEFFAGKACCHCGSTEKLELDHIDRTTKISHNIWSWTEEKRNKELDKCQILCYTCHKGKSRIFDIKQAVHGGYSMYWTHDCRCEECLEWKAKDDKRKR